jgi:HD domain
MTTKMYQLSLDDLKLNHALPWDVYDAAGKLLLCRGYVVTKDSQLDSIIERGMFVEEAVFAAATQPQAANNEPSPQKFNPFWLWDDIHSKLSCCLKNVKEETEFQDQIENYATLVQFLSDKDADVGISVMMLNDPKKSPISHMMHVAIVVELVSKRLEWPINKRKAAICAALTMNISMLELQTRLLIQRTPLSEEQLHDIKSHPKRSHDVLKAIGVNNEEWLAAVRDHHENKSGTGYPREIKDAGEMAELLHIADVFCAKITPRAHRPAMAPNQAARELFMESGESNKNPLPLMLIKEIGIFPPGAFVTLANKEMAIVVRRGTSANTPIVFSLIDPTGAPYGGPVKRDTGKKEFAITGVVPKEKITVRINHSKIWGYE